MKKLRVNNTERRRKQGRRGENLFFLATVSGLLFLAILLLTICNDSFGLVAIKEEIHPDTLVTDGRSLDKLSTVELAAILENHLSKGQMQALLVTKILPTDVDRAKLGTELFGSFLGSEVKVNEITALKKFSEITVEEISELLSDNLSQQELLNEVTTQVVGSEIIQSWSFLESAFNPQAIMLTIKRKANGEDLSPTLSQSKLDEIKADYAAARLEWKTWLDLDFITSRSSSIPGNTGIRGAIIGSVLILVIAIIPATFIGVSTALYLEEYAKELGKHNKWIRFFQEAVETNIRTLAGVPSVIYGLLGLVVFANLLEPITSGQIFGLPGGSGRTVLTAGLTLGTLILPIVIINAQEAIKSIPYSVKEASYGAGASKAQTIIRLILPSAVPGIMTGIILSLSRAIGETAPLVVVGAAVSLSKDPSLFQPFTTLTVQIYNWASQPDDQFRNAASAAILMLLIVIIALNATSIFIRQKFSRRLQ